MRLDVLISGRLAGLLALGGDKPEFRYAQDYGKEQGDVPLSAAFPIAGRQASGQALEHWLEGLLPDDPDTISALCSEYGIGDDDRLLLLGTPMGADCAGAVQEGQVREEAPAGHKDGNGPRPESSRQRRRAHANSPQARALAADCGGTRLGDRLFGPRRPG